MKQLVVKDPIGYWAVYIPFAIIISILILLTPKDELFLWSNQHHSYFFDVFFKLITYLGNGLVFVILLLILVFYKLSDAILAGIVFLLSAIIPQIIKKLIFPDALRPYGYFQQHGVELHLVEGVQQHSLHSFPSGHSASIFAMTLLLAFIIKDKRLGAFLCLLAIITAYSRIYLSHHYAEDVLIGSIIGCVSTLMAYVFFYKVINKSPILQKGILKIKK